MIVFLTYLLVAFFTFVFFRDHMSLDPDARAGSVICGLLWPIIYPIWALVWLVGVLRL